MRSMNLISARQIDGTFYFFLFGDILNVTNNFPFRQKKNGKIKIAFGDRYSMCGIALQQSFYRITYCGCEIISAGPNIIVTGAVVPSR